MAKSFLAAQIAEIREGLHGLQGDVQRFNSAARQVTSGGIKVASPGAPGGNGPVLFGPTGSPVAPAGGVKGSLADWLAGREANQGKSIGGNGSGPGFKERPATTAEKAIMATLKESLSYVRKLMQAAGWARLSFDMVLRSPKPERDALIAAWEESGTAGGGGVGGGPQQGTSDDLFVLNTAGGITIGATRNPNDPGAGAQIFGNGPPVPPGSGGSVFVGGGSQSGPMTVPTAGDKFVAEAVGKVGAAIDKLSQKIDTQGGLGFRKMGI